MKLLKTINIEGATIDVWQDDDGTIVVGDLGWVEYYDYEHLNLKERKRMSEKKGLPKFPEPIKEQIPTTGEVVNKYYSYMVIEAYRKKLIAKLEKRIEKDKKRMGGDLAYWMDIRPILESLK